MLPRRQAVTEGVILGDFEGDKYKTEGKEDQARSNQWNWLDGTTKSGADKAIEKGKIIAEAQNFARTLANEPANI